MKLPLFQSRTGSPGHLAHHVNVLLPLGVVVSIPNGLPRPFSLCICTAMLAPDFCFNPERAPQAI